MGIGGAGTVGGEGIGTSDAETVELDAEAPSTYPRGSLVSPLLAEA